MDRIWIILIGIAVAVIAALIWEDSREWLIEAFDYVFSFSWFEDVGEFFSTILEGATEFSTYGVVFGFLTVVALYFLSDWTLKPFLEYYTPAGKIIWGSITYVSTFIAGYLLGVFFENSG